MKKNKNSFLYYLLTALICATPKLMDAMEQPNGVPPIETVVKTEECITLKNNTNKAIFYTIHSMLPKIETCDAGNGALMNVIVPTEYTIKDWVHKGKTAVEPNLKRHGRIVFPEMMGNVCIMHPFFGEDITILARAYNYPDTKNTNSAKNKKNKKSAAPIASLVIQTKERGTYAFSFENNALFVEKE